MTRMPRLWASSTSSTTSAELAVLGKDGEEVADVVAAVAQRRLVERQQPQAVDPEPLQVVELGDNARQVAGAVVVGVVETPHQDLVEGGGAVPLRIPWNDETAGHGPSGGSAGGAVPGRGGRASGRWRIWATRANGSSLT